MFSRPRQKLIRADLPGDHGTPDEAGGVPRSTVAVADLVDQVAALEQRISQLEERLRE
jgi:hypothetical protein